MLLERMGEKMITAGIVAEYNPFHNGHELHIKRTREELGGDAAIACCMSGDFVQRGEAALYSKFARAEAAVRCGADLVLELPLPWSLASAENFARGAVGLLGSLGVVSLLSFGSECGDAAALEATAEALLDPAMDSAIREELNDGIPYAAARQRALAKKSGEQAELLSAPNNILAVEYIKAIYDLQLDMGFMTIKRVGAEHDGAGEGVLRSASELRTRTSVGEDVGTYMPPAAAEVFERERDLGRGPILAEALEPMLLARLRMLPDEAFNSLPDSTEGLGNRLAAAAREEPSWEAALSAAKSKRYALSRIRRMYMCACLGVKAGMADTLPPYARVLASNESGREVLRQAATRTRVPLLTKSAAVKGMSREARDIFELGARAHDFYVLASEAREERRGGADWRQGPAII